MDAAGANLRQAFEVGRQLHSAGRLGEAEAVYRRILTENPRNADAVFGLAEVAVEIGSLEAAVELFRQAISIRGDFAECWTGIGTALRETGDLDDSLAAYRRAAELDPRNPSVHNNLANLLKDRGELQDAAAGYRLALALNPDFIDARLNLGIALLLGGELAEGFAHYEARQELREPIYPLPAWKGEELRGRRVLLYTRQGLGDVIQFIRYAPMVASRGGEVVVACRPELQRLLDGQLGIREVVLNTDPLPAADVQCSVLSLPHIFRTTLETIPDTTPYLNADAALRARWRSRLEKEPSGLRVGLNWAGNLLPRRNRKRTIGMAAMAPLADIRGVRFYSLQKGADAAAAAAPPAGMTIVDWTNELNDLADTAALISNLDLVITCDTSVAHLAGALGAATWVGLPFAPDWRWLLGRADCPWYPTVRLFRQPRPGDWGTVVASMAAELSRRSGPTIRASNQVNPRP